LRDQKRKEPSNDRLSCHNKYNYKSRKRTKDSGKANRSKQIRTRLRKPRAEDDRGGMSDDTGSFG